MTFQVDAYPGETVHRHGVAGAPGAGRRAERRQLRDGDRRAEPGPEAEAGHDGERGDRAGPRRRRAARCRTRRCASGPTPRRSRRSARPATPAAGRRSVRAADAAGGERAAGRTPQAAPRLGARRRHAARRCASRPASATARRRRSSAATCSEGARVVTGAAQAGRRRGVAVDGGSPLMPQRPRRTGGQRSGQEVGDDPGDRRPRPDQDLHGRRAARCPRCAASPSTCSRASSWR